MSTAPLLECVPNFSEGHNPAVLSAIAGAIRAVSGVRLLEVDAGGPGTNRTVMSFAGAPEAVVEAAFAAIRVAAEQIDMRQQRGEHPRMGATDVCPLVPISGMSLAQAAEYARELGARVGALGIPVFLYEAAATAPHRRSLAAIRQGEYEGWFEKIKLPEWQPDYGPAQFNPIAGGTVIGARPLLVAFNVNLATDDVRIARSIAADVRTSGRGQFGPDGKPLRGADGQPLCVPGLLQAVRAIGWHVPELGGPNGRVQVSMNLLDIHTTPLHVAFAAVQARAAHYGTQVTGSELVGLLPKECLLAAAAHMAPASDRADEAERIAAAVAHLGLSELRPFDPSHKVLEYALAATWQA